MDQSKKAALNASCEEFMKRCLHEMSVEGIEQYIHPHIMGFGTTVQEEVYNADEFVDYIKLQEDLSRAILNLCNNAFDAMREKKNSVDRMQDSESYSPKLSVRTSEADNHIRIEIEDNGPGISDDMKDKVMQPFFTTKKVRREPDLV